MKRLLTTGFLAASVIEPAFGEPPWGASADLAQGEKLHGEQCVACHARMYGGDGSKMYTRDGRMLSTRPELLQQVATCNSRLSTGWFPEEEAHVAAWLNHKFYRFEK